MTSVFKGRGTMGKLLKLLAGAQQQYLFSRKCKAL